MIKTEPSIDQLTPTQVKSFIHHLMEQKRMTESNITLAKKSVEMLDKVIAHIQSMCPHVNSISDDQFELVKFTEKSPICSDCGKSLA